MSQLNPIAAPFTTASVDWNAIRAHLMEVYGVCEECEQAD